MKRRLRHSLSGRLIGLFLLAALALSVVVQFGFKTAFQGSLREITRPHVAEYVQQLLNEIGNPPDRAKAAALARRLPLDIHISGPQGAWSSSGAWPDLERIKFHQHRLTDGEILKFGHHRGEFVLIAERGAHRLILIPRGLQPAKQAPLAALLTIIGVLTILMLAYHGIRRLFRPIDTIRGGLQRIGSGDLQHRIDIKRRDELGELAASVNQMADDIRAMLEAKRQLLLAISHELRSPLTRAKVNLALSPESETRHALARDLAEMETLTSQLLETEKLNARHTALNLTLENPAELAREVISAHFAQNAIRTDFADEGIYLSLDAVRFRLLLRNLLDNALRHTPAHRDPPRVSICVQQDAWTLSVEDEGSGIAPEHLRQITQPFYRADPSRGRKTGGLGLGLYLCRGIVEAHGGRLEINSHEGHGTQIKAVFLAPTEDER